MKKAFAGSVLFLLFSAAAVFGQDAQKHAPAKPVTVDIINGQGHSVGTAVLSELPHGVKITLNIRNLPPGPHLMHIHQYPKCDLPDFKSAGPHFNPSGAGHGEHGPTGVMAGDIPNFVLT